MASLPPGEQGAPGLAWAVLLQVQIMRFQLMHGGCP
jgi:hypothetical protein